MATSSTAPIQVYVVPNRYGKTTLTFAKTPAKDAQGNWLYDRNEKGEKVKRQNVGFAIGGGSDQHAPLSPYKYPDNAVYVTKVHPASTAAIAGLQMHDKIISINAKDFSTVTHKEAVDFIKSQPDVLSVVVLRDAEKISTGEIRGLRVFFECYKRVRLDKTWYAVSKPQLRRKLLSYLSLVGFGLSTPAFISMASTSAVNDDNGSIDKKRKKREERSLQKLMQSVEHLPTAEEKLQMVCRKYVELYEENRTAKDQAADAQKRLTQVIRERDHLQAEYNKLVLVKDRLETLCRELQKVNKAIKEDSAAVARTNEEKRIEVSASFQTKIVEIQTQITEYHEQNLRLRAENDNLATKLKEFVEQFEQRNEQMERVIKTKELESQLAEAKMKQAQIQLEDLNMRHLQELAKHEAEVDHHKKRFAAMEEIEAKLREQNDFYRVKYEEFTESLKQSAEVYSTYKTELEKMAKRIEHLSKESLGWKRKYENCNASTLALAKEKLESEKTIATLGNKVNALEKLCRALRSQSSQPSAPEKEESPVPAVVPVSGDTGGAPSEECPSSNAPSEETQSQEPPLVVEETGKSDVQVTSEESAVPDEPHGGNQ